MSEIMDALEAAEYENQELQSQAKELQDAIIARCNDYWIEEDNGFFFVCRHRDRARTSFSLQRHARTVLVKLALGLGKEEDCRWQIPPPPEEIAAAADLEDPDDKIEALEKELEITKDALYKAVDERAALHNRVKGLDARERVLASHRADIEADRRRLKKRLDEVEEAIIVRSTRYRLEEDSSGVPALVRVIDGERAQIRGAPECARMALVDFELGLDKEDGFFWGPFAPPADPGRIIVEGFRKAIDELRERFRPIENALKQIAEKCTAAAGDAPYDQDDEEENPDPDELSLEVKALVEAVETITAERDAAEKEVIHHRRKCELLEESVGKAKEKIAEQKEFALRFRRQRDAARMLVKEMEEEKKVEKVALGFVGVPQPTIRELQLERGALMRERAEMVETIGRLQNSNDALALRIRNLEKERVAVGDDPYAQGQGARRRTTEAGSAAR